MISQNLVLKLLIKTSIWRNEVGLCIGKNTSICTLQLQETLALEKLHLLTY